MFKYLNKKRGQSTLEYAILIIIIIGALLSIQVYIKRGVQGRLRSATDDIGQQFSPGNMNINKSVTVTSSTSELFESGETSSILLEDEATLTDGSDAVLNVTQDYWGTEQP